MYIVIQDVESRAYNIPGYGNGIVIKNLQSMDEERPLGKAFKKYFPNNCKTPDGAEEVKEDEKILLVEEPTEIAQVVKEEVVEEVVDSTEDKIEEPIRPFDSFSEKADLKEYAFEKFGCEIKGNKSLSTMYAELLEFIDSKESE